MANVGEETDMAGRQGRNAIKGMQGFQPDIRGKVSAPQPAPSVGATASSSASGTDSLSSLDVARAKYRERTKEAARQIPEAEALQGLAQTLKSLDVSSTLGVNGRGTAQLAFTMSGRPGVVFWDDGQYMYSWGDGPYVNAGADAGIAASTIAGL